MEIGFIGLGKMGFHMAERLLKNKHKVIAYNRHYDKTRKIIRKGAKGAKTIEELVNKLRKNNKTNIKKIHLIYIIYLECMVIFPMIEI